MSGTGNIVGEMTWEACKTCKWATGSWDETKCPATNSNDFKVTPEAESVECCRYEYKLPKPERNKRGGV